MFQIFFVPKYFLVLKAVIFGTLLPEHPVAKVCVLDLVQLEDDLEVQYYFS